jgi:hypothetical protein
VNQVVFDSEGGLSSRLLLPSRVATSPVAETLVRRGIVPNERAARVLVVALAALGVGGAFTSIYLTAPNRGTAGVEYADLSAAERAEVPAAERAYLEHLELVRRERGEPAPHAVKP